MMLTILIPTYNEKNNITNCVKKLNELENLKKINFKIFFVDDNSKDGSKEELNNVSFLNKNVEFKIRTEKKRDLTQSIIFALEYIDSDYICVIDCDLQHNYRLIPDLINSLKNENYDLVIASRNINGKLFNNLNFYRKLISKIGVLLCKLLGIRNVTDPLSGFFAIKTNLLKSISKDIKNKGFKILLSILFFLQNRVKIKEIGTTFSSRKIGKSKLNIVILIYFIKQYVSLFLKKVWWVQ